MVISILSSLPDLLLPRPAGDLTPVRTLTRVSHPYGTTDSDTSPHRFSG